MTHASRMRLLALGALASLAAMPASAQSASPSPAQPVCQADGAPGVKQRHHDWIMTWDKQPGDAAFALRAKFGTFYDWGGQDVHLYDDFDPQRRVARSAQTYGTFWAPPFTDLRSARHAVLNGPDIVTGTGDLAASTLEFVARLEAADGKIVGIRTRSSLVWRCHADGWRIVREHNSSLPISSAETDQLLKTSR
jgi:ketosteroid isomerase-like protein